jgi:C4-dicarboxylate transporter DctM subunit
MKRLFTAILVIVVLEALCGKSVFAAEKVYKIKFSTVLNERSTWYQLGLRLAENMEKETNGRITVTCFANEQLSGGNQQKGCEMLMNGSTEIDVRSSMIWSVVDNRLGVWAIPFFYKSLDDADGIIAGEGGKAYAKVMEEKGIKLIAFGEDGMRQIVTNKPLKSLNDIKGMKIRVGSIPLYIDGLKALGANPLAMNWSEMYTGLQTGTVDGMESPTQVLIDNTVYEVCKYIYYCDWNYDPAVLTVNLKFYQSLPDDLREIFERVCKEAVQWQKDYLRQLNVEAIPRLEKEFGCIFEYATPEERQKFIEAVQPVVDAYEKLVGKEYVNLFRR